MTWSEAIFSKRTEIIEIRVEKEEIDTRKTI